MSMFLFTNSYIDRENDDEIKLRISRENLADYIQVKSS